MAQPLGSRAARKRAATVQPTGVLGAAIALPRGGARRQLVRSGAAGAAGGAVGAVGVRAAVGAAALLGGASLGPRDHVEALPVARVNLLVVTADELSLLPIGPLFGRLDRGVAPLRIPVAEIEAVELGRTPLVMWLRAPLSDGTTLELESKRIGANRPNVAVLRLVQELVAAL